MKDHSKVLNSQEQSKRQLDLLKAELQHYKNKEKMNDSKDILESKVIDELEEWNRQIDTEKEEMIKLHYENEFLRSRNADL